MNPDLDKNLLLEAFYNFPVCSKPYQRLAETLEIDEAELMDKLSKLKSSGHVRQIGPVFDYNALGYEGTLLAARVKEGNIDIFSTFLKSFSGVTHCYVRESEFNIWFTYIYKDEQEFAEFFDGLLMHQACDWLVNLPKKRVYKNAVNFKDGNSLEHKKTSKNEIIDLDRYRKLIDALQTDLQLGSNPFLTIAKKLKMNEARLFKLVNEAKDNGLIKRFGARLNHVKAGLACNALYVAKVDERYFDQTSNGVTDQWNVSHCYLRYPTIDWPYNFYAMVHGEDENELLSTIESIKDLSGAQNGAILYTVQELIKRRPVFLKDADCRLVA